MVNWAKIAFLLATAIAASMFMAGTTMAADQANDGDQTLDADISASSAQVDDTDSAENETNESNTSDLPVEPPSDRALPTYDEVRRANDTDKKVRLGRMLYHDPRISETGSISCNSCHNVMEGGDGSRTTGRGVHGQTGPRNSPTVWNSAFMATQFWDGRADSLSEQAKGPITAGIEMGMPSNEAAMDRIRNNSGYVALYEDVYGGENPVNINNTVDAIAAYERTLITPNSSYDQYVNGDEDALTQQQLDGMREFKELGCANCHSGPALNGPQWKVAIGEREEGNGYYRKLGVYESANPQCSQYIEEYNLYEDSGRAGVTGESSDEYRYKVPTLRNTEITAPYLHNGQVRQLNTTIKLMAACQVNENISDQQAADIEAFLNSTTGEFPEQTMPRLPSPSGGPPMIPADAGSTAEAEDSSENSGSVGTSEGMNTEMATPTTTTGGSGPGFTGAVAAAALATALALVAIGRRRAN